MRHLLVLAAIVLMVLLFVGCQAVTPTLPAVTPAVKNTAPAPVQTESPQAEQTLATVKPTIIASGGLTTTVTSTVSQPTAAAPVVDKRPIPPGKYLARINANPSLGVDGGYYAVRLDADDSYRIVWFGTDQSNLDAGNPGMEGVLGTYAITGDQVVFTDVEGFAACSAEEGVQGTYRFAVNGNSLRFTNLNDNCGARAHILSTQSMRLQQP